MTLEQRLVYNSGFVACFEPIYIWLQMYRAALPVDAPVEHGQLLDNLLAQLRKTQATIISIPSAFPEATLLRSFGRSKTGLRTARSRMAFLQNLPHEAIDHDTRLFLKTTAEAIKQAERILTQIIKSLPIKSHLCSDGCVEGGVSGATRSPPIPKADREGTADLFTFWWRERTDELLQLAGRADNAMDEMAWIDHHVSELASMAEAEPKAFKRAQRELIARAAEEVSQCDKMLVAARDLYITAEFYD